MIQQVSNSLRMGVLMARTAAGEMGAAKAQLKEMAERIEEQKKTWEKWPGMEPARLDELVSAANKFKCRFREIDLAIDALMTECRLMAEEQTYAGGLVSIPAASFFQEHAGD